MAKGKLLNNASLEDVKQWIKINHYEKNFGAKPLPIRSWYLSSLLTMKTISQCDECSLGGISEMNEISICVSKTQDNRNILKRKAFTVSGVEADKS